MNPRHLHPMARTIGLLHGHRLHIARPVEGVGYVARCSCREWGNWYADRRVAVLAFLRNHLGITTHKQAA